MKEATILLPDEDTDWLLQQLVLLADTGLEMPITLQVSGLLVSGLLVDNQKYFDGFGSDLASGFQEAQIAEGLKELISKYGDAVKKNIEDGASEPPRPKYIHLRNAKFFNTSGNPIPANRGVWWRGRLCEVSGFIIGSLNKEP